MRVKLTYDNQPWLLAQWIAGSNQDSGHRVTAKRQYCQSCSALLDTDVLAGSKAVDC